MTKPRFADVLTETFFKQRYLEEKQSLEAIGEEVGTDRNTVRKYLGKFNIPVRTSAESRHKYVDSSGFEDLSTDWHAYWVGFLAADGCIFADPKRKNVGRVQVIVKMSDADHLRDLQQGLKTSVPVTLYSGQRDVAKLILYDRTLIKALAKWGIVPNKTLTMPWPLDLPSTAIPAYIRGYFDGDGTIFHRHRSVLAQPGLKLFADSSLAAFRSWKVFSRNYIVEAFTRSKSIAIKRAKHSSCQYLLGVRTFSHLRISSTQGRPFAWSGRELLS